MVANTDELILEKSLTERLRSSQQTLMEAIRQRDNARLEVQRLTLALRDFNECRDQMLYSLLERLREVIHPEPVQMGENLHIAICVREWPVTWHFPQLFDAEIENPDGEQIQVQLWLCELKDQTATYEVCRLV